jgi:5-methylthioadenosine/S-adenosylhomocysteine deaminase
MYQEVFGPDPRQCHDSMTELRRKVDRLRPRQTTLVRLGVSPHAPYTVSDSLFSSVAAYASSADLPVAVHIAESELEHALVVRGEGAFADGLRAREIRVAPRARSPVRLLAHTGVLGARPLLIHCVRVDADDIAAIASTRCSVAHCPASNAKLGHGIAPVAELLAANIPVGLGSDSVASNNRMDLLEEARLATFFQRARLGIYDRLSAQQAMAMLTIGGAAALGLQDETGSLEVGKAADLAAFPLDSAVPTRDPLTAVLFALPGSRASFVAVAGRPLVEDGVLLNTDPTLERRVQASADALDRWLSDEQRAQGARDSV